MTMMEIYLHNPAWHSPKLSGCFPRKHFLSLEIQCHHRPSWLCESGCLSCSWSQLLTGPISACFSCFLPERNLWQVSQSHCGWSFSGWAWRRCRHIQTSLTFRFHCKTGRKNLTGGTNKQSILQSHTWNVPCMFSMLSGDLFLMPMQCEVSLLGSGSLSKQVHKKLEMIGTAAKTFHHVIFKLIKSRDVLLMSFFTINRCSLNK